MPGGTVGAAAGGVVPTNAQRPVAPGLGFWLVFVGGLLGAFGRRLGGLFGEKFFGSFLGDVRGFLERPWFQRAGCDVFLQNMTLLHNVYLVFVLGLGVLVSILVVLSMKRCFLPIPPPVVDAHVNGLFRHLAPGKSLLKAR